MTPAAHELDLVSSRRDFDGLIRDNRESAEFWLLQGNALLGMGETRRAAENSHTPFFCCQDGFLTTHTLETVQLPEPELMKSFVGAPCVTVPGLTGPKGLPIGSQVVAGLGQDAIAIAAAG